MAARRGPSLVVQRTERQDGLVKRQRWLPQGWFFTFTRTTKEQARTFHKTKAKERIKKDKGNEGTYPQCGLSASEAPEEEGYSHAWESDDWSSSQWPDVSWTPAAKWYSTRAHTAWMAVPSLNLAYHPTHVVLDLGCTRSIGSR